MVIKGGFLQFVAIGPLVPIVKYFRVHTKDYLTRCRVLGRSEAIDFDERMANSKPHEPDGQDAKDADSATNVVLTFDKNLYQQPELYFDVSKLDVHHRVSEAAAKLNEERRLSEESAIKEADIEAKLNKEARKAEKKKKRKKSESRLEGDPAIAPKSS